MRNLRGQYSFTESENNGHDLNLKNALTIFAI